MVTLSPHENVSDYASYVDGSEVDLERDYIIAHDIEGVLIANGEAYCQYVQGYLEKNDIDVKDVPFQEGVGPMVGALTEFDHKYKMNHFFGELGSHERIGEEYEDLADTPLAGLMPFHAKVDEMWEEDAERINRGEKPKYMRPCEDDIAEKIEGVEDAVEKHILPEVEEENVRMLLVTGRPEREEQMKTVLAYYGIEEGEHYDGFHIVSDAGEEDKMDKAYDLIIDDSPDRIEPENDGEEGPVVWGIAHPRNEVNEDGEVDRNKFVGPGISVPTLDDAETAAKETADVVG